MKCVRKILCSGKILLLMLSAFSYVYVRHGGKNTIARLACWDKKEKREISQIATQPKTFNKN